MIRKFIFKNPTHFYFNLHLVQLHYIYSKKTVYFLVKQNMFNSEKIGFPDGQARILSLDIGMMKARSFREWKFDSCYANSVK